MRRAVQKSLACLYYYLAKCHRTLFLKKGLPLQNARLIIVGSFRAGGAGKTPFAIHLAKKISEQKKMVALLTHSRAEDEYFYLQNLFLENSFIRIFKTKNRYRLAHQLDKKFDVILCDDGLEDTRLIPDCTILLRWGEQAQKINELVPFGTCRSLFLMHQNSAWQNSEICQFLMNGKNPDICFGIEKIVSFYEYQQKTFNFLKNETLENTIWENITFAHTTLEKSLSSPFNVVCGIGNPKRFIRDLEAFEIPIHKTYFRKDHDAQFLTFLQKLVRSTKENHPILLTEKDAARLILKMQQKMQNPKWSKSRQAFLQKVYENCFVAKQKIKFSKQGKQKIQSVIDGCQALCHD